MVYDNHDNIICLEEEVKLDRITYEQLKSKDYNEAIKYFTNLLRNELLINDSLATVVSAFTLAAIKKDIPDSSNIINYLEEKIADETTISFLKKTDKELYSQIDDLSNKYDLDTLKAAVLFSESKRFSQVECSTPEGIVNLAISLLSITKNDVVLDLGSGVSSFLIQAAQESQEIDLYGVEINTSNVVIANLRRYISGLPIKVIQGNIISQDHSSLLANKVFSNFPLGMKFSDLEKYVKQNQRLKKYFKDAKRTVSGDWVYGMASFLNMRMPGKTVVLMTNSGTWNKPDELYRQKLVEDGNVEGVILLPPRLLSSTNISLTMLILSQENKEIRMLDASEIFTEGRRQNTLEPNDIEKIIEAYYNDSDISKKIKVDNIAKQEYILNPQRYINLDIGITDGIRLGDLCMSINRGAMVRSDELDTIITSEETNYRYLMLQNIQDGVVDTNLPYIKEIDERYKRYCIKDKDLIISKISPFKVATMHLKGDEVILANGNLYFLELDEEKINPVFLQVFLQSEKGMAQLNRYAKGAAMQSISIQDLKMIQIPNVSRAKQDIIANEYKSINDELIILQRQIDMIQDKKSKLLEGVI
jgi:type I restriction enzyme M protein